MYGTYCIGCISRVLVEIDKCYVIRFVVIEIMIMFNRIMRTTRNKLAFHFLMIQNEITRIITLNSAELFTIISIGIE